VTKPRLKLTEAQKAAHAKRERERRKKLRATRPKPTRPKCTATSKRSGERCRRWVVDGKTVCLMHGGKTPSGAKAPSFVTGYYSKAMPPRLAERYLEALKDPELIALRREAALTSALIERGLERLDSGESGSHWARLQKAWADYESCESDRKRSCLGKVGDLIVQGGAEVETERELRRAIVDKMKVAESERRRLIEKSQVITVEELVALVASLAASISAEVSDRTTRERILARLNRALSIGA